VSIDRGSLANIVAGLPPADYVVRMAAAGFGVTIEALESKNRSQPLASYRQVTMAALRIVSNLSYPGIGRCLGGRDHSTVMSGCARCRHDPLLARALEGLIYQVRKQWALDNGLDLPVLPGQLSLEA
jgi:chromosomal replication initiator protein